MLQEIESEKSESVRVNYVFPRRLRTAARVGAKMELMSESEFLRRALVDRLRAIGIDPSKDGGE